MNRLKANRPFFVKNGVLPRHSWSSCHGRAETDAVEQNSVYMCFHVVSRLNAIPPRDPTTCTTWCLLKLQIPHCVCIPKQPKSRCHCCQSRPPRWSMSSPRCILFPCASLRCCRSLTDLLGGKSWEACTSLPQRRAALLQSILPSMTLEALPATLTGWSFISNLGQTRHYCDGSGGPMASHSHSPAHSQCLVLCHRFGHQLVPLKCLSQVTKNWQHPSAHQPIHLELNHHLRQCNKPHRSIALCRPTPLVLQNLIPLAYHPLSLHPTVS